MCTAHKNKNLVVNIAADGVQKAVISDTTLEPDAYKALDEQYVRTYLEGTSVCRILFNVCYKRTITDSNVFDSVLYNVALDEDGNALRDENGATIRSISPPAAGTDMLNNYRELILRGIDVIEMLVNAAKQYGAEAWLSVRVNDHHFADDPGFNSILSYSRADEVGVNGSRMCLDYSHHTVRNYYKAYLLELAQKYQVDGIEMDFLRSAPLLSDPGPNGQAILNAFMQDLRQSIPQAAGRPVSLCARVFSTPEHNLSYGIDAAQWIADGSIEFLTVSGFYIPTYYSIPVDRWRALIDQRNTAGHSYSLLAGTDWGIRCDSRPNTGMLFWITLEQIRGFASSAYQRGADGIYFFNHFCTDDLHGAVCYYMDEAGNLVPRNVLRDKFAAANSQQASEIGERVYVNTCQEYSNTLYPILLSGCEEFCANMNTGNRFDNGSYRIILGLDADSAIPKVSINGTTAALTGPVPKPANSSGTTTEGSSPVALHISTVAPQVIEYDMQTLTPIKTGENMLCIQANGKPVSVLWIEIRAQKD